MGFFNDLKADFVQAVNELTEDNAQKELAKTEEELRRNISEMESAENLKNVENTANKLLEETNDINEYLKIIDENEQRENRREKISDDLKGEVAIEDISYETADEAQSGSALNSDSDDKEDNAGTDSYEEVADAAEGELRVEENDEDGVEEIAEIEDFADIFEDAGEENKPGMFDDDTEFKILATIRKNRNDGEVEESKADTGNKVEKKNEIKADNEVKKNEIKADNEVKKDETKMSDIRVESVDRKINESASVITAGTVVTGNIISEDDFVLNGKVEGDVESCGTLIVTGVLKGNATASSICIDGAKVTGDISSDGTLEIGSNSVVVGNIKAIGATISGAVKGDVDVKGPVILESNAIVVGNIKSKTFQIMNGAIVEGTCSQCYGEVNIESVFDNM